MPPTGFLRRTLPPAAVFPALLASACSITYLPFNVRAKVVVPPQHDLVGIRKLAIVDFKGDPTLAQLFQGILATQIFSTGRFRQLERSQMRKILEEQRLTGQVVEEANAQKVGRLLGVDALIIGEFLDVSLDDEFRFLTPRSDDDGFQVVDAPPPGPSGTEPVPPEGSEVFKVKIARATAVMRVVNVGSGELLAAQTQTERVTWIPRTTAKGTSLVKAYAQPPEGVVWSDRFPPDIEAYRELLLRVAHRFTHVIAPTPEEDTFVFQRGDDALERGFAYAENGLWKEALEEWEKACRKKPERAPTHYDLALAYLVQGDLRTAETEVRKAIAIEPDDLYLKSLKRILDLRGAEPTELSTPVRPPPSEANPPAVRSEEPTPPAAPAAPTPPAAPAAPTEPSTSAPSSP